MIWFTSRITYTLLIKCNIRDEIDPIVLNGIDEWLVGQVDDDNDNEDGE